MSARLMVNSERSGGGVAVRLRRGAALPPAAMEIKGRVSVGEARTFEAAASKTLWIGASTAGSAPDGAIGRAGCRYETRADADT